MMTSRNDFRWALALLGLSGAAALGQQLLWTRRMADLIGATGDASAGVFGCFFLGLALGAAAVARFLPRLKRPWRVAAVIEVGIAVLGLPALLVNHWSAPLWPLLGPEKLVGWQGAWLKSLLSVVVIVPPAFLVGMVLPVLTFAAGQEGQRFSSNGLWLYAGYTLGGALGIAVTLGAGLPRLGASGCMLLMAGVNVAAGLMCWLRDAARTPPNRVSLEQGPATRTGHHFGLGVLLLLSFLSGAGVLALEVAGLQLLNLKAPLALYTPGAILFCVVLLLAVSAGVVASVERLLKGPAPALVFCAALAGLAVAGAPLLFLSLTAGRSGIGGHGAGFGASLLQLGAVTYASIGPAVLVAGMVFPLLISALDGKERRPEVGFARLLAINGVGGLAGAEAAHRWLLPALGPHLALGTLGAGYGVFALALSVALHRKPALLWALPIGSLLVTGVLLSTELRKAPIFLHGATFSLLELRCGREGTLAIAERPDVGRAMFLDNHYMLGCSAGTPDMQRQAHVPLLLHPKPERVCFLGVGTGITAAGALKHAAVESVEAIELSPLVAEAAKTQFAQFNSFLNRNPRVRVVIEDARTYIAASKDRFDVIIGDLFTPWRPGEAHLCSLEQLTAAKAALRPGGVFCQWLPMTQLTREHFELIAGTFRHVFGEIYVFRNHFQTQSLPLALVGFKDGMLDWQVVARRCEFERTRGLLRDPLCRHAQGVALLYLGSLSCGQIFGPRLNTLDNLSVELRAGRHLLGGNPADYFAGSSEQWAAFVQAQLAGLDKDRLTVARISKPAAWPVSNSALLPEPLRPLPRLGLVISNWKSARESGEEARPLPPEVETALSASILADTGADWSLWPVY